MPSTFFDELTTSSTTAKRALGSVVVADGCRYMYVQVHASSTSALAANSACYLYAAGTDYVVNSQATLANGNLFVGISVGTIAAGSCGWVLIGGPDTAQINDASSVSTIPSGSIVYGCSTDKSVALVVVGSATTSYLNYRPVATTTAATVSSTSTPRTVTVIVTGSIYSGVGA